MCLCVQINSILLPKNKNGDSINMTTTLLFMGIGMQELLVIMLIVLLIFGGKKIPELMKGLGKGVKNFKDGVNGLEEDLKADPKKDESNQPKTDKDK